MRILTVSAYYESHGGGIEIVAGSLARALARRGHESCWAGAALDPTPDDEGLFVVPFAAVDPLERWTGLPMPVPSRPGMRLLEQAVASADAAIIHDSLYLSSLLAARYAAKHNKPWLLIQHIGEIPYTSLILRLAMATANGLLARPLVRVAPQSVFISDVVRQYFAGPLESDRHALMFNGVDHSLFHAPATKPPHTRQQLLFVGRFVEKKGLKALRKLAALRPGWDFSMVGSGPLDPTSWGLANVHVLGRKTRGELADLYRSADALVLPSVGEGFPLVIQEAMATGLPVFCGEDSAAADPGARHILNGIQVVPDDPEGTARRFAAALDTLTPGIDAAAALHARRTYDWDRNAEKIERWLLQSMT